LVGFLGVGAFARLGDGAVVAAAGASSRGTRAGLVGGVGAFVGAFAGAFAAQRVLANFNLPASTSA